MRVEEDYVYGIRKIVLEKLTEWDYGEQQENVALLLQYQNANVA